MSESSSYDASCIFCRIAAGKIPCHKIYEDQLILCFLDIGPVVTGHTLVIPKQHVGNIFDMPPELGAQIARRLPGLARAVCAAVDAPACHILQNNGAQAMQSVGHAHYHILPRKSGDGFFVPWNPGQLDVPFAKSLIVRIQNQYAIHDDGHNPKLSSK